jgi:hypothetical protein
MLGPGLMSRCLAAAQQQLSGAVSDAIGRPVAQASLELRDGTGAVIGRATTDDTGHFKISAQRGTYSLISTKHGFKTARTIVTVPCAIAAVDVTLDAQTALTVPVNASVIRAQNSVSTTGANKYTVTAQDIANLPRGENTTITDVLVQMPGVALDQNQQIHIRNTEGPQFQYEINNVMVPFDINTNPPFISMINPMFIRQMSLLDGILPSRYSFATGGVVNIQTKDGCEQPGGSASIYGGQRNTVQPSFSIWRMSGKIQLLCDRSVQSEQ